MRQPSNPPIPPLALSVIGRPGETSATIIAGDEEFAAMVGRSGVLAPGVAPAEGDGATPNGRFGLRQVYYRADRRPRPVTRLPIVPITQDALWCDDPGHGLYNRPVTAPFTASAERLWMERRSYDVCIVLDFNLNQPLPGAGSAIFFHLTRTDDTPPATEGCVAVDPDVMEALLPRLGIGSTMTISLKG